MMANFAAMVSLRAVECRSPIDSPTRRSNQEHTSFERFDSRANGGDEKR
jgi:hypothetical protein